MCSCFCLFSITLHPKDTIMDNDYTYPKLFHIDSQNIRQFEHIVRSSWNGFLLCKQGSITLFMDGNRYDIHTGDLYIYPAFSETRISEFSPDFKAITGIADLILYYRLFIPFQTVKAIFPCVFILLSL